MSGVRSTLETWLTRAALAVVPRLPRRSILRWSRLLGRTAYHLAVHLRQVGRANLDLAYGPEYGDVRKAKILKASFETFALMILDSFWFSRDTAKRIREHIHFDPGCAPLFQNRAQICVTAHLGNWEVLGLAFVQQGFPLVSVAAPLRNQQVDTIFNRLREQTGQQIVSKHRVLRTLLRTLRENGKVALLLDQNTKPDQGGVWRDYFGLPVPVASTADALKDHSGAEVYFGACLPQPDGSYVVPAPDRLEDGPDLTSRIIAATEKWVRRYPEHWLWTYKRWKYVAPGRRRDEYPFYAKTTFAQGAD